MDDINKVIIVPFLRAGKIENAVNTLNVAIKDMESEPPDNYIHDENERIYIELNNLISNIHGEGQLIELYVQVNKVSDEKPLKRSIDSIKQNCLNITKFLNNMIEVRKIEQKQLCLYESNVNIVEIMDDIVINVSKNIKNKRFIFDTNIEEQFMRCDIDKFQKAILILLSAAVRFSEGKEINVNLNMIENNINITILFKNRNSKLLNFFIDKMDNLNKNSLEDLSVGFYICKTIIKLHQGHIDLFKNGEEVGFSVQLPCEYTGSILHLFRNDKILNNENLTEQIQIEFSDLYWFLSNYLLYYLKKQWGKIMDKLEKMIIENGEVREGNILKVDSFLNHQLNPEFLYQMGEEFYRLFKDKKITRILTIEASGIAIAVMAALVFKVPLVFAKKTESLNLDKDIYTSRVYSYTKNKEYNIMISKKYLHKNDKILIIDDFLAEGNAMKGLIDVAEQSGAQIAGIGIAIEKGFQQGGKNLRAKGYNLESLAIVDELKPNGIKFRVQ